MIPAILMAVFLGCTSLTPSGSFRLISSDFDDTYFKSTYGLNLFYAKFVEEREMDQFLHYYISGNEENQVLPDSGKKATSKKIENFRFARNQYLVFKIRAREAGILKENDFNFSIVDSNHNSIGINNVLFMPIQMVFKRKSNNAISVVYDYNWIIKLEKNLIDENTLTYKKPIMLIVKNSSQKAMCFEILKQ